MASFSAGTTFTDGVANDVTAAKLAALVNAATPTSGLIQDRTSESAIASNDTLLFGDASASDDLKRITVSNLFKTDVSITSATGTAGTVAIGPTGDTNTGIFFPAADTIAFSEGGAESMRINSSGNVGIGTTSPTAKLDVYDSTSCILIVKGDATVNAVLNRASADTVAPAFQLRKSRGSVASPAAVAAGDVLGNINFQAFGGANNRSLSRISGNVETYVSDADISSNLTFLTSTAGGVTASEKMRIDSSGNVGIGTTSPAAKLDVYGDGHFQNIEVGKAGQSGNRDAIIDLTGDATYTDYGFRIIRQSTGPNADTILTARGTGNVILQSQEAGQVALSTSGIIRMTVNSGGNVGIGTTSPSAQLELSTDSAKKPSTNTWTIASDQRLKTNITNADNDRCYEIVKQVPLKRYTWKNEVYSQDKVKDRSKLGWIAQDVEAVFPKAVGTNRFAYNQVFEDVVTPELDSDGNAVLDENGVAKTRVEKRLVGEEVIEDCKDLNSDQIYAAMYGTIQKLIEKVETLEAKVAALEAA